MNVVVGGGAGGVAQVDFQEEVPSGPARKHRQNWSLQAGVLWEDSKGVVQAWPGESGGASGCLMGDVAGASGVGGDTTAGRRGPWRAVGLQTSQGAG